MATCTEVKPDIEEEEDVNEQLYKKCGRPSVNAQVEKHSYGHQPHYVVEVEYKQRVPDSPENAVRGVPT